MSQEQQLKRAAYKNSYILEFPFKPKYSHVFNLLQISFPLSVFMTVYEKESDNLKKKKKKRKSVFRVFKFKSFMNLHIEEFIANVKGLKNRTV